MASFRKTRVFELWVLVIFGVLILRFFTAFMRLGGLQFRLVWKLTEHTLLGYSVAKAEWPRYILDNQETDFLQNYILLLIRTSLFSNHKFDRWVCFWFLRIMDYFGLHSLRFFSPSSFVCAYLRGFLIPLNIPCNWNITCVCYASHIRIDFLCGERICQYFAFEIIFIYFLIWGRIDHVCGCIHHVWYFVCSYICGCVLPAGFSRSLSHPSMLITAPAAVDAPTWRLS